jgi:hypothetical protein
MGNRAVITLDKKPTENSVGIYLHWNGGPESILAFAEAGDHLGINFQDESYATARLAQIICNFFGGTNSVGVGTLRHLDTENYDNGTYRISYENDQIAIDQSPDGKTDWKRLDNEQIRKHSYWKSTDGEDDILTTIIKKNQPNPMPIEQTA